MIILFVLLAAVLEMVHVIMLLSIKKDYFLFIYRITLLKICFSLRFVGGKLNVCYNAVDRHVETGRGDQAAVIYDSPVTSTKQVITYREMQEQVICFGCLKAMPYLPPLQKSGLIRHSV